MAENENDKHIRHAGGIQRAEVLGEQVVAIQSTTGNDACATVTVAETHVTEVIEEDPRLQRFAKYYKRILPEDKARCSWQEVKERLLANNGHYLALANAMNEGGILFGVDKDGNPLIADDGKGPIMTGMNYCDTRKKVYFKDDECKDPTGYEMFPFSDNFERDMRKSPEIRAFERFTLKPFIVSHDRGRWLCSWLESGENPSRFPYLIDLQPYHRNAYVQGSTEFFRDPRCGVRRLLRVKKS